MENSKRIPKTMSVGDAAVEGLMYGIAAGIAMALFVLLVEWLSGVALLTALGYFDGGGNDSPFMGAFTHIAVAGIYGAVFGMIAMVVARMFGARMTLGMWLALGILYGALIFVVAEWIVLPRTSSPLLEMPMWALAIAHFIYGAVLAALFGRNK
ncbi:MAG: hypothetical protein EYC68_02800 [Chloroflexota bacterium]|nr:MAG: hypothetical protein EYC68_02800 [Chloroflexota bacterium]